MYLSVRLPVVNDVRSYKLVARVVCQEYPTSFIPGEMFVYRENLSSPLSSDLNQLSVEVELEGER